MNSPSLSVRYDFSLVVNYIYIYMMDILPILEQVAREAGATALSYFHKELQISYKTNHQNVVTIADTVCQNKIQTLLIDRLTTRGIAVKDIGFIGEENLETQTASHMFVIDPIDGTANFASGLDYFCTSIAYFENGVQSCGVVYWPARDIVYFAKKGLGAFKKTGNGKHVQLHVREANLDNSVVLTYISSNKIYHTKQFAIMEKILPQVRGFRLYGSACLDLCHLADSENEAHIVWYMHTKLWDLAATSMIVREAGGILTDLTSKDLVIDVRSIIRDFECVAGSRSIVSKFLSHI